MNFVLWVYGFFILILFKFCLNVFGMVFSLFMWNFEVFSLLNYKKKGNLIVYISDFLVLLKLFILVGK